MAGVQDDDVAYGADQLLFQVQAIMAAPELTVWLSPNDMSSIFGDINKAGSALRAYRDKFGMTERRARSPEAVNSVRDLKVKLASVAVAAGATTLAVGAAESGGIAAGLVRAFAAAGVGAFAWAAYFSQLDDSPSKYRDYGSQSSSSKSHKRHHGFDAGFFGPSSPQLYGDDGRAGAERDGRRVAEGLSQRDQSDGFRLS